MDDPWKENILTLKRRILEKLKLHKGPYGIEYGFYRNYILHYNDCMLSNFSRLAFYNGIQNKSHLQLSFPSKPALVTTKKQSSATLNYKTTVVEVPETGVRLDVPEGAISCPVDIILSVHWGGDHHPPLKYTGNQFVIGPSVCCEPDGTMFQKPVTLTIPHSARNITSRNISVWTKSSRSKYR